MRRMRFSLKAWYSVMVPWLSAGSQNTGRTQCGLPWPTWNEFTDTLNMEPNGDGSINQP